MASARENEKADEVGNASAYGNVNGPDPSVCGDDLYSSTTSDALIDGEVHE